MLMMYEHNFHSFTYSLTDDMSVGTQDHRRNLLQKLKHMIERSLLLHSVLHLSISSSQGAQTRCVFCRCSTYICSYVNYRPLFFMTSGLQARNYTYSSLIQTKSFICPGHHTIQLSSPLHLVIGESIYGICRKLASNKPQMIRRMVLRS